MATKTKAKGKTQRKATPVGLARTPDLGTFYRNRKAPFRLDNLVYELALLSGGKQLLNLGPLAESVDWTDEAAALAGTMALRHPSVHGLDIRRGDLVRLRCRWTEHTWYELWRMRCGTPEYDPVAGTFTVELADDLAALDQNRRDWTFRKTKHRKRGFFLQDFVREVCRREGVRAGLVTKGRHEFDSLVVRNAGGLTMLKKACEQEKQATGRKLVIRMRNGRLDVTDVVRNPILYTLSDQIMQAIVRQQGAARPVTVITGTAHIGRGKHRRKIRHTELRRALVDRLGYVHKDKPYGNVTSMGQLKTKVKRDLAKAVKLTPSAQVTHALLPFIARGDGVELLIPGAGFKGTKAFVYVVRAVYHLEGQQGTMELEFARDDPYKDVQDALWANRRLVARLNRQSRKAA